MKNNVIVTVAVILIVNATCTFQFDPVCVLAQCIRWGCTSVYLREVTVLNQDHKWKTESRHPVETKNEGTIINVFLLLFSI